MSVNQRLVNPLTDNLFDIILKLETREECYEFFEDLCTINELHDMSQRLEVARMLRHGEKYDKIEEATGASTATISRVNWKGCRSFTGPVPPLLMMNFLKFAVMRCIRIKMEIYYALYLKMSILTYLYYKI